MNTFDLTFVIIIPQELRVHYNLPLAELPCKLIYHNTRELDFLNYSDKYGYVYSIYTTAKPDGSIRAFNALNESGSCKAAFLGHITNDPNSQTSYLLTLIFDFYIDPYSDSELYIDYLMLMLSRGFYHAIPYIPGIYVKLLLN